MVDQAARVRRGYFECRFGQLHVYYTIPSGGGFDEGTALICLHSSSLSGRMLQPLLMGLGGDRSVYAPDLPGSGASDPPPPPPSIGDYAAAVGDFCDAMRFRQIDVLGCHSGALVAAELAVTRPRQVRRLVLADVPLWDEARRETCAGEAQPVQPAEDGSHLLRQWRCSMEALRYGVSLEVIARGYAEGLYNGPSAGWGVQAALRYAARERLPLISQPTLVLWAGADPRQDGRELRRLLPAAHLIESAQLGHGFFDAQDAAGMQELRDFLQG